MGKEINLLINYPKIKRNIKERGDTKTQEDRAIARQFGKDFFDGKRRYGYGGFYYMERFWSAVVPTFQNYYGLTPQHSILDIGAAKGFMIYDFQRLILNIKVSGCDISDYAVKNSKEEVRPYLKVANATDLPYEDQSFDLVISINTLHNLEKNDLARALQEIKRVSRKNSFITVDAYRNDAERKLMYQWNLTAKTIMHVDEWKAFFNEVKYTGDYYWFTP